MGVALGTTSDRRWFALPALVTLFLFQHAIQGWCPPVPILRRLGFRTSYEIEEERRRAAFPHTACMGLVWGFLCQGYLTSFFVLLLHSFVRPALPRDDPRGACHWPRAIAANHACIRLNPYRVPTMKQSYASAGKAPRRRVHSPSGIAAIAVYGLPPPRIVIGYRASSAVRCRTLFVLCRSTTLLTPPAATRHRLVSHRS